VTIVSQLLTNSAYGFPTRGAERRVKPVALACIHITGNERTAAYDDLHAAAKAERDYANRANSGGPSAHLYVARDGWAIRAINAVKHAAWSNGDIRSPITTNPGVRRVLALVDRGFNANEAYWEEIENLGYGSQYPITAAQKQADAEIIAARSVASGLPINRETVHGHWEINSVTRWSCPSPSHEPFLNDVIARANALVAPPEPIEEPDMPGLQFRITGHIPGTVKVAEAGHALITVDTATFVQIPAGQEREVVAQVVLTAPVPGHESIGAGTTAYLVGNVPGQTPDTSIAAIVLTQDGEFTPIVDYTDLVKAATLHLQEELDAARATAASVADNLIQRADDLTQSASLLKASTS
jgi:hypothetical protein